MRDLTSKEIEMNKTLNKFGNWSQDSNLALNPPKTKSMLYSTSQMSSYHSLSSRTLQLSVQGKDLERVKSAKLLGVHLNENLNWDEHVKHLASSCYGTLACLRKIKNFTPYKLRKHLAESLILSRLDFNDIIFYPLTERLINRLQRVQYSAASFVTGKYVNSVDSLFKLGWLPMRERRDWHLLKAVHKALYSNTWPQSLRLEKVKHTRTLRSSSHINLVTPLTRNTFQDSAATVFNSLPTEVKSCVDPKSFSKQTFEILRNRSLNK